MYTITMMEGVGETVLMVLKCRLSAVSLVTVLSTIYHKNIALAI